MEKEGSALADPSDLIPVLKQADRSRMLSPQLQQRSRKKGRLHPADERTAFEMSLDDVTGVFALT